VLQPTNPQSPLTQRPEELAERFFSGNSASYDHIARLSTLGLDAWWKRKIVKKLPAAPALILEQASGTGLLTCKIARRFPNCRIVGVELHEDYLNIARAKVHERDLGNVEFIHGRAECVLLEQEFDCIVSDYLAKYVDLERLVAQAWKMLRNDGLFIAHDFTPPTQPLFSALWHMHFKCLQAYGRWKHPEWSMAFGDVPVLLKQSRWVDDLTQALRANHFSSIAIDRQIFGLSAIVSARKRS
jgi:demethylmenaquinone methyltransferase/2-methoxy-6-polyprenyl-1,4-benzoquinol methylase